MKRTLFAVGCALSLVVGSAHAASVNLSGRWAFALDANDVGIARTWFDQALAGSIRLPGSLQEQGYGAKPSAKTEWTSGIGTALLGDPRFAEYVQAEDFMSPFWLTPDRHYVGAAWYQRQVTVPADWKGKRIALFLERPHWQTTVWVDGHNMGTRDGLGMVHEYDLTAVCEPGHTHRLTIRVDNREVVPVGKDAHSISDQTQSNWNGIAGRLELRAGPKVWFDDVQIHPNLGDSQVRVVVQLGNGTGVAGSGLLRVHATSYQSESQHSTDLQTVPVEWSEQGGQATFAHSMGSGLLAWDEYSPALYRLELELVGDGVEAQKTVSFGMRELGIQDKQFTINGRKIFLRGTLECCIFPQHGYPPTDVGEWKRIIGIAKAHGLNHFRFHSWCPPEAAYVAADEMGFYLQVEGSCWAAFGDGTALDTWIYAEIDRMIRAYGNHPSFCFFSPSNEPSGRNRDRFLGELLTTLKAKDDRRFYVAGAGWPQIPENQYSIEQAVRLQRWPTLRFDRSAQTFDDYRSHVEARPIPVVGHEIGQWCAYPDLAEENQYRGVLKAKNMAIFRDKLDKAGMGHLAHDFLMASGKFQTLLYKQEIEAALRTPGFAGFALLDLHDFPGQGTAPVGVLNALWQSKGYVTPEQYRRFCNDIVPLARMKKRVFTSDETFEALIEVANYGPSDLTDAVIQWTLRKATGRSVAEGRLGVGRIANQGLTRAGQVSVPLAAFQKAAKLNLDVRLQGTSWANDWDIWVYPVRLPQLGASDIVVTQDAATALERLQAGGRVLLVPDLRTLNVRTQGTFRPIFWNRITFPKNVVHTLGILCDPDHPALPEFPTDFHSNWQWQDLLDRSKPLVLSDAPSDLWPIVQPIDDWNDARKLAVLLEARVGSGRLMLCAMDILTDVDTRPVARQLRYSLLRYMNSDRFSPRVELSPDQLRSLLQQGE
ncbi:MAG: hypothetical protein JW993_20990 [Sedimentisphaerales bacterium]|nr:hypothetical protein [Sedimentisphaerales bacterium]